MAIQRTQKSQNNFAREQSLKDQNLQSYAIKTGQSWNNWCENKRINGTGYNKDNTQKIWFSTAAPKLIQYGVDC